MAKKLSPELLNSSQVAEILGISLNTVLRRVTDGTIAATKLPGQTGAYVFERTEVERVKAELTEQSKAATA
jgi:excisionase family DNA binding protein